MPRKNLSKMAAAFKACVELHQRGELDDYLLPVKDLSDDSDDEDQETAGDAGQAKSGTKRKKQAYKRKVNMIITTKYVLNFCPCFQVQLAGVEPDFFKDKMQRMIYILIEVQGT
jgi:hypothetical protein